MPYKFANISSLSVLLERNKSWATKIDSGHPELFNTNATIQTPQILWIGCSDSRAGESCIDLIPGEAFVHRNIGNVVSLGDLQSVSVLQFASQVLKVKHVIVCGHTDCGAVKNSLAGKRLGLIDSWLSHLKKVAAENDDILSKINDPQAKANKLSELNVIAQVHNVKRNAFIKDAIAEYGLKVYGALLDVGTGVIREVEIPEDVKASYFKEE